MAPDPDDGSIDRAEASHGSQECMPCRGTGKVISNLGGSASKVTCPWCEGDGVRHPEIDAQARWLSSEGEDAPEDDEETEEAAVEGGSSDGVEEAA